MKKTISLLLALVMCLFLCACSGGKDTPEITETPATTQNTAPVETKPQYTTVEITIENWQDYFEFAHFYIPHMNAFGEVEGFGFETRLYLKDGYQANDVNIAIEYSNVMESVAYEANPENGTITFGEPDGKLWGVTKQTEDVAITSLPYCFPTAGGRSETSVIIQTNYEVLRIQGTINITTGEGSNYKEIFEGEMEIDLPAAEDPDLMYVPYIGKWVASNGDTVIIHEDGTLIYNDTEYSPEYINIYGGVGVALQDVGEVFVWGLADKFGEGVMISDRDGRQFILQVE